MSENFSKKEKMEQDHCANKKRKYDLSESSSSPSSSDEYESVLSDDDIIGNDSSDYNERIKFGGTYMLKKGTLSKNVQLSKIQFCENKAHTTNFSFNRRNEVISRKKIWFGNSSR